FSLAYGSRQLLHKRAHRLCKLERPVLQIAWLGVVLHFGIWDLELGIWNLSRQRLCSGQNCLRHRLPFRSASHALLACSWISFSIEATSSTEARRRWYFRTRISFNVNKSSSNGRSK